MIWRCIDFFYLIYFGFYVAFNTIQVISRRVVGRAEETSTYSWSRFCTVNGNFQLSHLRSGWELNPDLWVQWLRSLIGLMTATQKQVHLGPLHMRPIRWYLKNHWRILESLEKVILIPKFLHPHLKYGPRKPRSFNVSHYTHSVMLFRTLQMLRENAGAPT